MGVNPSQQGWRDNLVSNHLDLKKMLLSVRLVFMDNKN